MYFKKVFYSLNLLFDRKIKISILLLILILLFVSIFELLSLATIPAYISYIISGEINYLNFLDKDILFSEKKNFNILFIFLIIFIFLIKDLFLFFANYY